MGLQGKKLGLWDYNLFEIGITDISFEIGIMDIKSNQKGIFHPCKIGITGLHPFRNWDYGITRPPYGGPTSDISKEDKCITITDVQGKKRRREREKKE